MTKKLSILLLSCMVTMTSCTESEIEPLINPATEIEVSIEKSNSDNNYTSKAVEISSKSKSSGWQLSNDGDVQLTREIMFDLILENGEKLEFGFWMIKHKADSSLLVLLDEDLNHWERNWHYKSLEEEKSNFYRGFDEAGVLINANVIFHQESNADFEIVSIKTATIGGEEKNYLTIHFSGTAYGWYDPEGKFQEVYTLMDGVFKSIIE